jgi:hypothetical protein
MCSRNLRRRFLALTLLFCALVLQLSVAANEPPLAKEQIQHFLLTAKVINFRQSKKGITDTWRLTLSDGTLTHDASFQPVDEHKINISSQAVAANSTLSIPTSTTSLPINWLSCWA